MDRAQKQEHLDFLKSVFSDVSSLVLSSVEGMNAEEVTDLRRRLHKAGVDFRVIKNKLAKIAAKDSAMEQLDADFVGSTAIAWSKTDAVTPAKVLIQFQKDVEKFQIRAGYNAGMRLDLNAVKALAELPSLEELRARLLGLMQAVPAKLLAQIQAPASHIVGVLQAKVDKDKEFAGN